MQTFWGRSGSLVRTAALGVGAALAVWPCIALPPSESVGVTHAVVEVVTPSATGDVEVDHAIIEVVTPRPPATIYVDHAIIEIVRTDIDLVSEDDDDDRGLIGPIVWVEWPRNGT